MERGRRGRDRTDGRPGTQRPPGEPVGERDARLVATAGRPGQGQAQRLSPGGGQSPRSRPSAREPRGQWNPPQAEAGAPGRAAQQPPYFPESSPRLRASGTCTRTCPRGPAPAPSCAASSASFHLPGATGPAPAAPARPRLPPCPPASDARPHAAPSAPARAGTPRPAAPALPRHGGRHHHPEAEPHGGGGRRDSGCPCPCDRETRPER